MVIPETGKKILSLYGFSTDFILSSIKLTTQVNSEYNFTTESLPSFVLAHDKLRRKSVEYNN